ncbi:MAG: PrsW family glutamic-type intramembrane protease [Patescibacteria group bacterium]
MAEVLESLFTTNSHLLLYSLVGGILPALFWLWFWLREDANHPEPRWLIFWTFIAGAASTAIALPLEWLARDIIPGGLALIIAWALIEETSKYGAAHFTAFKTKDFDEPIDALIYLITASLGFSATENVLFLIKTIGAQGELAGFLIGNVRFVGASLLHIVSSAFVGGAMALAFYHGKTTRRLAVIFGIIGATALHTAFNFFIIDGSGSALAITLSLVWVCVIVLILFFEKAKTIRP